MVPDRNQGQHDSADLRIGDGQHPIVGFSKGPLVNFYFEGQLLQGCEGEPVAAALHAAGIRMLGHSRRLGRPRGFFCAMGKCSSCRMVVDGVPDVMVCVTPLRSGMVVERTLRLSRAPLDAGQAGGSDATSK